MFLAKLQAQRQPTTTLLNKRHQQRCFPLNIASNYFKEHLQRAASGNLALNGSDTNFTDGILFFTDGNLSLSDNVVYILDRNSINFKQKYKQITNDKNTEYSII